MKFKQVVVITKLHPKDMRPKTRHTHRQTLKSVLHFLKNWPVNVKVYDRSLLSKTIQADLIITVGGDGTALAASHHAGSSPLFCINSVPETSTGFFCRSDPKTFPRNLRQALLGLKKPVSIPRLAVFLNGRRLKPYGLNEILFTSKLPGDTTRYLLQIGKQKERQKSSGVWVATGAGSTAAIYSAGGKKDSPLAKRLQYKVREPCRFPKNRYRLLGGFLKTGETVKILSEISQGMVFIDGPRWRYPIRLQDRLTIHDNQTPLHIYL